MEIKQNLVPQSKYSLKCPYSMTPIGICVHNTANDASANNEISYMATNANQTSFHLAIDDIEIWQGLPLNRNGWHAGDGGEGDGNRKYIGIEICYSKSGGSKFIKAEENTATFIAQLLKERNWGIERVKKHQDFSGKYCPHRTLDMGWERFINLIKSKLGEPMSETIEQQIYKHFGVQNFEELKVWKEREAKFLEEERRRVQELQVQITDLQKQIDQYQPPTPENPDVILDVNWNAVVQELKKVNQHLERMES